MYGPRRVSRPMGVVLGELVDFTTSDGLRLHGFLTVPKKRTGVCVVYVHGMTGNFYCHALTRRIGEAANAAGFAFLSINTRGQDCVACIPKTNGKRVTIGTAFERFEDCVMDIRAAVGLARRSGFRQVVLVGHSTGCQKIAYYQHKIKDRSVTALVLLAPADDYAVAREELGNRWSVVLEKARRVVRRRALDEPRKEFKHFSARRFLSTADLRNPEARVFRYDGPLREFSSIRAPILAVFGNAEQYAPKPVAECLELLGRRTRSRLFSKRLVPGNHSFAGHEALVGREIVLWLRSALKPDRTTAATFKKRPRIPRLIKP